MQRLLATLALTLLVRGAMAVPVTFTLTADFPNGGGPGTPVPYHWTTSFSMDSTAALTDVYVNPATTFYGYSASSLSNFGFTIGGTSYTAVDIVPRSFAIGHASDFYLDAPVESGSVSAMSMLLRSANDSLSLGGTGGSRGFIYFRFDATRSIVGTGETFAAPLSVVTSSNPALVPEPGSIALLGLGAAALFAGRRKTGTVQRIEAGGAAMRVRAHRAWRPW